ncbi:hypothetical protein JHK85_020541 [Glycine max]|nr:hypothetical protein JHK87_019983 [Glycine soja]KAG5014405.1 hypothetical protein JHK85_020541 [Glycine max]KHN16894.1 (+)-neomenthol dehydrogenase [Glycine soja]
MGHKEKSKERKEKRLQEISLLRTIPYADHQRWWSKETIAVVTGGNRGIGFEISRQLADHGVTVILTSRDASVGVESIKVLQEGGIQDVACHQLDILDTSSINQFCEWLKENYGGLDILVNNAGVNFNFGSDNSVENAKLVIETNYYGTKRMIQAMIPLMKSSSAGGRIVNVSSRLGRLNGKRNRLENEALREQLSDEESLSEEVIDGMVSTFLQQVEDGSWKSGGWPPTFTDYSVSKLAVNSYTRFMAKKLSERPDGEKIYINSYCPGWVKTALTGYAGSVSVEDGADSGVWLSLLPDQAITGKCFCSPPVTPFTSHASYDPNSIHLSNQESKRRLFNRLLYRSKQRGFLELDLVLGKWVEDNIHSLDEYRVRALILLLDLENPDLWKWISGQEQPPESININPVFAAVREGVMKNLESHSAPETRATPGKPWVRGWDDIKKFPGGSITGNQ